MSMDLSILLGLYDEKALSHDWPQDVDSRREKLNEEFDEYSWAIGTEGECEELADTLICTIQLLRAHGVVDPLDFCYRKLAGGK